MNTPTRSPDELARLTRRGFWLEYASMAWMTVEAAVAITAGVIASSIALAGFGLESGSSAPRSSSWPPTLPPRASMT